MTSKTTNNTFTTLLPCAYYRFAPFNFNQHSTLLVSYSGSDKSPEKILHRTAGVMTNPGNKKQNTSIMTTHTAIECNLQEQHTRVTMTEVPSSCLSIGKWYLWSIELEFFVVLPFPLTFYMFQISFASLLFQFSSIHFLSCSYHSWLKNRLADDIWFVLLVRF